MAAKAKKAAADESLEDRPVAELKEQAEKDGVDVEGSGAGGRVLKADLVEALDDPTDGGRPAPDAPNDARSNPELNQPKHDAAMDKVRENVEEHRLHWRFHNRSEVTFTVTGEDDAEILIRTVAGKAYVSVTDTEIVLGKDAILDLYRAVNSAHLAL